MEDHLHELRERLKESLARNAELQCENHRLKGELSEALAHLEETRAVLTNHHARLKSLQKGHE